MTPNNPLQKYFRQPKIYISLPSKGLYYERGVLGGDYNNVPIFAMSGMDEIIFKTPDALFSGEATAKVIESCCPYIKDGRKVPGVDVDALMVAIRIATFGSELNVAHTCKECASENEFEIQLSPLLDYFNSLKFTNTIQINDDISIKIRPLQYDEMNHFSMENFRLQRTLFQSSEMKEEERGKVIDQIYKELSELQLQLFLTSIESVNLPDVQVTDKTFIEEWLRNAERDIYAQVKSKLEENKAAWDIPKQHIKCNECGHEDDITVTLDQSSFFG
jgi:hypothetical protein